ncbi:alpha/beta hydrolase family protein, partial [Gemmatimonadota bacterium]
SGEVVRLHQGIAISGFAVGSLALVAGLIWLAIGGSAAEPIRNAADETGILVPALDLPDPSGAGSFRVLSLTYGSGTDRHRPEFGSEVGLTTGPVDGTPFVDGWEGYVGWFRDRYWGFSVDSLPLNGRVWYPDGPGPFPLMLVVHGNHLAEDFSDPGYEYLGELLASRGLIVVSVDENFLNSTLTDVFSGLETENDARGWLLLEHLSVWRAWNDSPGNPFHGKVDLGNIGLVGHSRGGEAVSEAASFNRLSHYPDDATVPFDYGFDLRAVIAIAPVDAQYNPTDRPTPIQDVNYLVLHGSMDGDVSSFVGQGTYERVEFTDGADWFKAAFYIHGANHGQFNTSWGRSDMGSPIDRFYNLDQIMPPEDQEKAAKVVISAFVEASLKGMDGYRTLFREPRTASHWLPETVYLSRFETAQDLTIASFEEDMDVATATLPGAQMEAAHLTVWREERVKGKWEQSFSTNAAFLGWDTIDAGDTASYAITLTPSMVETGPETVLVFGLADANEDPNPGKEEEEEEEDGDDGGGDEKANEEGDPEEPGGAEGAEGEGEEAEVDEDEEEDKPREPIDFTIQVWDATGQVAGLPLSSVSLLQPQIEVGLRKANFMDDGPKGEIVLESFEFPLVLFREANPSFDPNTLTGFRFVFDLTEAGVIVLDGVAFREREIADGG